MGSAAPRWPTAAVTHRSSGVNGVIRAIVICFLCLVPGVAGASPVEAQSPPAVDLPQEQSAAEEDDEELVLFPDEAPEISDDELRAQGEDPCALNEEGNWVDWLNRKVTSSVCGSARWFDSFFGTQNEFDNRQSTFGRLGVGAKTSVYSMRL